eukprot:6019570-Amphidinium_carterae.1
MSLTRFDTKDGHISFGILLRVFVASSRCKASCESMVTHLTQLVCFCSPISAIVSQSVPTSEFLVGVAGCALVFSPFLETASLGMKVYSGFEKNSDIHRGHRLLHILQPSTDCARGLVACWIRTWNASADKDNRKCTLEHMIDARIGRRNCDRKLNRTHKQQWFEINSRHCQYLLLIALHSTFQAFRLKATKHSNDLTYLENIGELGVRVKLVSSQFLHALPRPVFHSVLMLLLDTFVRLVVLPAILHKMLLGAGSRSHGQLAKIKAHSGPEDLDAK